MRIGYARVSTDDQDLSLQLDALQAAGCGNIFRDTASGAKVERPGLSQAFDHLRLGDTLVVWRLDRLGRSLSQLITLMTQLDDRGVGFRSLTEQIDTATPGGKLIFHLFGALAEFERNLIRERTMAGLAAARARGRRGGRPKLLETDRKVQMARQLHRDHSTSIADICQTLGISRATLYRYLATDQATDREEARPG
ncbi:MAG: recombinase family protein [Chloroflexota bacterium]|nr:recombinase family protein [Chloroflexota bacterium]